MSASLPRIQLMLPGGRSKIPREGLYLYRPLSKRGQTCDIPAPPIVERLWGMLREGLGASYPRHYTDCLKEIRTHLNLQPSHPFK